MKDDWQSMSRKELRRRIKETGVGSQVWMAATHELSTRKGITPVATLIIALLTLLVALGAWLFPKNLNDNQSDSLSIEQSQIPQTKPALQKEEVFPVVEADLSSSELSPSISSPKIELDGVVNEEAAPPRD